MNTITAKACQRLRRHLLW